MSVVKDVMLTSNILRLYGDLCFQLWASLTFTVDADPRRTAGVAVYVFPSLGQHCLSFQFQQSFE